MDNKKKLAKAALTVTRWIGSPLSLFVHTLFFGGIFVLGFSGRVDPDYVFAITTNILSIEAIYLAIFIQMTINYQAQALEEVQEDVEEIQEDVQEITEDVGEIQEDVGELQEDVEDITEEQDAEEVAEEKRKQEQRSTLESIEDNLQKLVSDIEHLKTTRKSGDSKPLF